MNDRRGYRSSNFDSRYGRDEGGGEDRSRGMGMGGWNEREGVDDRGRMGRVEEGRFRGGVGEEERIGRGRHEEGLWDRMRGEAREGWEAMTGRDEDRFGSERDPGRYGRRYGSSSGMYGSGYGSSGMYGSGYGSSGMHGSGYGEGLGYGYGSGYGGQGYGGYGRGREDLWGRERGGRQEERGLLDRARDEVREGWEAVKETFAGRGPKGYKRSDDRIRDDVCDRLTRHPGVDASEIEVAVRDGEVVLTGAIVDRRQKRIAEDVVEDIDGVRDVNNQLRVKRLHGETGREVGREMSPRDNGVVTSGSSAGRGGANATR